MDFLLTVWEFIGNLDNELALLLLNYGGWIYLILFLIIFCETGLVVTPSCRATRCCSLRARSGRLPTCPSSCSH